MILVWLLYTRNETVAALTSLEREAGGPKDLLAWARTVRPNGGNLRHMKAHEGACGHITMDGLRRPLGEVLKEPSRDRTSEAV